MPSGMSNDSSTGVPPPLKYHGGKRYLAKRIVAMMPPRCKNPNAPDPDDRGWLHYVEPYAGGLSVLLANEPEGISEVANDLNEDLTIFWRVLQCLVQFPRFAQLCEATPFSEDAWVTAGSVLEQGAEDEAYRAWAFFVRCRQSLAGRMDAFAPLSRSRTRRGMNEQASAWLNAVEGLPQVHARMKRVVVLNRDALEVIRQQDGPRTLFYCDPPYLHETRATTGEYEFEMTKLQHIDLLACLSAVSGRFLLSGYRSDLYDGYARAGGWKRYDFELPNNAAGGDNKRRMTECVWTNYEVPT